MADSQLNISQSDLHVLRAAKYYMLVVGIDHRSFAPELLELSEQALLQPGGLRSEHRLRFACLPRHAQGHSGSSGRLVHQQGRHIQLLCHGCDPSNATGFAATVVVDAPAIDCAGVALPRCHLAGPTFAEESAEGPPEH